MRHCSHRVCSRDCPQRTTKRRVDAVRMSMMQGTMPERLCTTRSWAPRNSRQFCESLHFPQFFFCNLLISYIYFRLVKVSPSRAQARNHALCAGFGKDPCTDLSTALVDKQKKRFFTMA